MKRKRNHGEYKKEWIKHHGAIQKDEYGRTMEIHHIDGDCTNNHIDNLICLTIAEHYEIHYWQEDWYAAGKIAAKMKLSHEELAELARKQGKESYDNGSNAFYKINEAKKDDTIHCWENLITGELVNATINEMGEKVGQKSGSFTRIVERKIKSFKNWRLYSDEKYERTTTHRRYDSTIYTWIHDDTKEIVRSTIKSLGEKCGSPSQYLSALTKKRRSVHKGWRLLKST
jgi:hypothetical protein